MPKFKVIHPIRHDGKPYNRGTVVDLAPKDAKRLQKFGHIEPANGAAASALAADGEENSGAGEQSGEQS